MEFSINTSQSQREGYYVIYLCYILKTHFSTYVFLLDKKMGWKIFIVQIVSTMADS